MRAALRFLRLLESTGLLPRTASVNVDLYGSLALTGMGHGTDRAVLLGLLGEAPDTVDPAGIDSTLGEIRSSQQIRVAGRHVMPFRKDEHLLFHREQMYPDPDKPTHPNGLRFTA